jgi:uncharacterized RDD family membrane protein YckC/type II secretory pathway pseudopilin PulG
VLGIVMGAVGAAMGLGAAAAGSDAAAAMAGVFGLVWVLGLVGTWLYSALLEASAQQATLGKMALGLAVTDAAGRRIGFGRATGRFFAKILSGLPANLGFVVAAFTDRKRALHDYVAGTLVVRKKPASTGAVVAVVALFVLGGIWTTGILAAIAIPNFMKYQLRAKASEAPALLRSLAAAEEGRHHAGQGYLEIELPAQSPGAAKLVWTPEEQAAAADLGWAVGGSTYYTYRVAVSEADDGREAYTACAEADIDGDGQVSAWVVFQPVIEPSGELVAEPPDPPCAHAPVQERAPFYQAGDPVGEPVRLSPENVY